MKKDKKTGRFDIAVVGAGVIGLACAFRLARAFRLAGAGARVVLIDHNEPGRGCSLGNAGHVATEQIFPLAAPSTLRDAPGLLAQEDGPLAIRPQYAMRIAPWLFRFALASAPASFRQGTEALAGLQRRAFEALRRLLEDAGAATLLEASGNIMLVEKPASVTRVRQETERLRAHGVRARWLLADEVRPLAPAATRKIAGAVFYPDTGYVRDPHEVCRVLASAFASAGGDIQRARIERIIPYENGFRLEGQGSDIEVQKVVIAAGAFSKPFAEDLGSSVPLDTERGYHLTADGFHADISLPVASYERKVILSPLSGGLRITGGVEFGGLQLPGDDRRYLALRRHLDALLQTSPGADLSRWMGFRPSLPDHLPVIGESPKHRDAFFAFGHQHLGLTLAGVTAEAVAAIAMNGETQVDLQPFRIDRF